MRLPLFDTRARRLAALMLVVAGSTLPAQAIEIHLRQEGTGAPVAGAVVRLLRDTVEIAQALTNAGGRAMLRAPAPGAYLIRVNRIGYKAVLSEVIPLDEMQTITKELTMASAPFVLPTVAVQTKSECGVKMGDGVLIAALWEQIGTALAANVLSQSQWAVALEVKRFRRDVALNDSVTRELVVGSYVVHGPPFGATDPALLAKGGFVRDDKDGMVFSAPDAGLLLSDEFINTHCFSAVSGPNDALGLVFEPAPRRRLPDVRGTLWIDRSTSELRFLDYAYTGLRNELSVVNLGGRLEFERLPTGAWIVSYWHIRMPHVEVSAVERSMVGRGMAGGRSEMRRVASYIDEGGRVAIAPAAIANIPTALIIGHIVDSTVGGGLSDAVVRVMGQSDSVYTDSLGQFRLRVPVGGRQTLVATHPKLGLVTDSSTRDVELSLGSSTAVELAVPPVSRLVREFCGTPAKNVSGIVGLTMAPDGTPTEGLDIRVTWEPVPKKVFEERAESGPRGIFVLCDLPPTQTLTANLRRGTAKIQWVGATPLRVVTDEILAVQRLTLTPGEFRWVNLRPPR